MPALDTWTLSFVVSHSTILHTSKLVLHKMGAYLNLEIPSYFVICTHYGRLSYVY